MSGAPKPLQGQQIYRHFDAQGNLLYVGMSINALARIKSHRLNASWFNDIASVTIQHFESDSECEFAEKLAIVSESPKYNQMVPYKIVRSIIEFRERERRPWVAIAQALAKEQP